MNLVPVFVPQAWKELQAAVEYFELRRAGLGLEFSDAIEAAVERARRFPERCTKVVGTRRDVRRVLVRRFPYVLVFTVVPGHVRIVAVAHSRRRHGYWKTRLTT